jgi:hypothetical protein
MEMIALGTKIKKPIGLIVLPVMILFCLFSYANILAQDTTPPEVAINYPTDSAVTNEHHMEISVSVDDESPTIVQIYGDMSATPTALQFAEEIPSGTGTAVFDFSALILSAETSTRGLWHFDENTGTAASDASGNGNSGAFVNDPEWTYDGRFGYALDFDGGNDFVRIEDINNSLDIDSATGTITIEAWIYPRSAGAGQYRGILAKRGLGGNYFNYALWLDKDNGAVTFHAYPNLWHSTAIPAFDEWSYIAFTLDATEGIGRFYLNGALIDAIPGIHLGSAVDSALTIGYAGSSSQCFNGLIDEVRISNTALDSATIAANYMLATGSYFWKVSAKDNADNETISNVMLFSIDTLAPTLTLNYPNDGSDASQDHMLLGMTVTDEHPVTVSIYGDQSDASQLLHTQKVSGTDIDYDWTAAVLSVDVNTAALYHFQGNADDASLNGNHGMPVGGVSYDPHGGRFNGAYQFDGTSGYFEVADEPSLDITDEITLEAWVYPTAMGNYIARSIVAKRAWGGTDCNYEMYIDKRYGNLSWYADGSYEESIVTLDMNVWQHVAITLNSSEGILRFYINGELEDISAGSFGLANDEPLFIGASESTGRCFQGRLDEVKISNTVLTPAEIKSHYRLGEGTYYWKVSADDGANQNTSETRSFTIHFPPETPELINPPDSTMTDDHTPTFEWSSTAGPGGDYTLEYAVDPNFIIDKVSITDITDTFYTPTEMDSLADNKYYWRVIANDVWDGQSAYQEHPFMLTIYTDTEGPEITLISPGDGSLLNQIYFAATVADQSYMDVKLYADKNTNPSDLIYAAHCGAGSDEISLNWNAPPLKIEPSTISLWRLNENTDTTFEDAAGKGNDGQFVGDPQWTCNGKFGYAIEFDGSGDYLVIPHDPSLDVDSATGAITIEAYIYPSSMGTGEYMGIIAKRAIGGAVKNYGLWLDGSNGALTFQSTSSLWHSAVIPPLETWSYIAFTLDASENIGRFYLNDQLVDEIPNVHFGGSNADDLTIGCAGTTNQLFVGMIDEVRISSVVLDADQIAANCNLSTGQYFWKVWAMDSCEYETTSDIWMINADMTEPTAEVVSPPSGQSYGYDSLPSLNVYFEDSVGLDRGYYQYDDCIGEWNELWSNYSGTSFNSYIQLPDNLPGTHSIYFMVIDDAGNINSDSCSYSWSWTYVYDCGDANSDGFVNVSDAVWIINYVFTGGEPPNPMAAGDVNCDSMVNVSDAVWIINFIFIGGNPPCDTDGDGEADC